VSLKIDDVLGQEVSTLVSEDYLKLNPPRASFMAGMNDDEKMIMQAHVAYWVQYVESGVVIVLGPVVDP
jgi:uncharacterized protein